MELRSMYYDHIPASRLDLLAVHRMTFLQEGDAEDVAFVLHADVLAYVSYIKLCFNLLVI